MAKRNFIPYNTSLIDYARENRKYPTQAEKLFWEVVLREKQFFGYKFRRQKVIGSFILDFYCSQLLLGIELDGGYHKKVEAYDTVRDSTVHKQGIEVIRFANKDIEKHLTRVVEELTDYIKSREIEVHMKMEKRKGAKEMI